MKMRNLILFAAMAAVSTAQAAETVSADQMGLSKTSVNDVPAPPNYKFPTTFPGSNERLPRAYHTAPPQIPHNIDAFLPVRKDANQCVSCHDKPTMRGMQVKGIPTAIPVSHYMAPAYGKPAAGLAEVEEPKLHGSRFVCTQCHVPQADAPALVENTF